MSNTFINFKRNCLYKIKFNFYIDGILNPHYVDDVLPKNVLRSLFLVGGHVKKTIEVSLLGQSFAVRSNKEEGHVHAVASMVNRRIQDLKNAHPRKMSDQRAALLVALNLADDLLDLESEMTEFRGDLREKTQQILGKVQNVMGESTEENVEKEHDVVLATVQK